MAEIDLRGDLKNLVESSTMNWTYGIFWRCSSDQSVLNFHDGYYKFKGTEMAEADCNFVTLFKRKRSRDTSLDLFFEISMNERFENSEDLPGHAFFNLIEVLSCGDELAASRWKRSSWGLKFGIQTIYLIPFKEKGVLELGSTEIMPYVLETTASSCPLLANILKHIRDGESFLERADNEIQNHKHNCLCKLFRGKKKISDSKPLWPLLTDSSTDRTSSCSTTCSGPSRIY